jgi:hypothetical protein
MFLYYSPPFSIVDGSLDWLTAGATVTQANDHRTQVFCLLFFFSLVISAGCDIMLLCGIFFHLGEVSVEMFI